jgi:hypothetical protein
MRSPGKRAVPRHRALSCAARAQAEPPGGLDAGSGGARWARARRWRRFGPALRRLLVTPTFAAGLGVVVAAVLAANMTKTVLHFSSPFPGRQCPAGGCGTAGKHGGTLASARPGRHITPHARGTAGSGSGTGAMGPGAMGGDAQLTGPTSHHVTISYRLTQKWSGGFADEIIIAGLAGPQDRTWSLAFGYPGARIASVQGARWQPDGPDSALAEGSAGPGTAWPGEPGGPGGPGGIRLTVTVSGAPMPPAGCRFDGRPCSFTAPAPGQQ